MIKKILEAKVGQYSRQELFDSFQYAIDTAINQQDEALIKKLSTKLVALLKVKEVVGDESEAPA